MCGNLENITKKNKSPNKTAEGAALLERREMQRIKTWRTAILYVRDENSQEQLFHLRLIVGKKAKP